MLNICPSPFSQYKAFAREKILSSPNFDLKSRPLPRHNYLNDSPSSSSTMTSYRRNLTFLTPTGSDGLIPTGSAACHCSSCRIHELSSTSPSGRVPACQLLFPSRHCPWPSPRKISCRIRALSGAVIERRFRIGDSKLSAKCT